MTQKKATNQTKTNILKAALACADRLGWDVLTLDDIAREARCKTERLNSIFPNKERVLEEILHKLHKDSLTEARQGITGVWQEDLFEILMVRFEFMQEHRNAYSSSKSFFVENPCLLGQFLPMYKRHVKDMLSLAGVPTTLPYSIAMGVIYSRLLNVWREDETEDMAKTMAAVDQNLRYIEKIQSIPLFAQLFPDTRAESAS